MVAIFTRGFHYKIPAKNVLESVRHALYLIQAGMLRELGGLDFSDEFGLSWGLVVLQL